MITALVLQVHVAHIHVLGTCALISVGASFNPNRIIPHPLQVIRHQSTGRRSKRTRGENDSVKLNHLQMNQGSPVSTPSCLSPVPPPSYLCCPRSPITIYPTNLCLLRTRLPLTSAINTLLVIRNTYILSMQVSKRSQYSLIHSILANSPSIPELLHTSSFLTECIRDTPTKLLTHFNLRTLNYFPSLSTSHTHASAAYNAVGTITPSRRHVFACMPNSPLHSTLFFSVLKDLYPLIHCVPQRFHILHQLPLATQVLKTRLEWQKSVWSHFKTFLWNQRYILYTEI